MKRTNINNIFFLELIFSIFIFIIVSTLCLQIFSKSHYLSSNSRDITNTLEIVQNEFELFYSNPKSFCSDTNHDECVYYSKEWEKTGESNLAAYHVYKKYYYDGEFYNFNIIIYDSLLDNEIYNQTIYVEAI